MKTFKEMKSGGKSYRNRNMWTAYLMIAPICILLIIFVFIPLGLSVVRSLQDNITGDFIGFGNFWSVLQLTSFRKSFLNMLEIVPIIVILQMVLSFFFALLISKLTSRMSSIARTIVYIPVLLSGIITSVIYLLIINYGGGLITSLLYIFGKDAISLVNDPFWAKTIIIIPTLWQGFGYNTLVMYAGLLNIPKSYYEAASIDGANSGVQLVKITLPNMMAYSVLLIINLVTGTLQMYEIPLMITGGGPLESTLTPVLFLMANFNGSRPTNVVIAGALLVMILIVLINGFVFRVMKSGSQKAQDA